MIKYKHMLIGSLIIFASIILDQTTKALALLNLKGGDIVVIDGFFSLELHYNNGAAWSSFAGQFWFLMLMTVVALVVFSIIFKFVNFSTKKFYSIGISLMIGGLFGNFIDRVFMDKNVVIDFLAFDFGSYSFPTFNIADSCLVVGVVLFLVDVVLFEGKRRHAKTEN